MQLKEVEAAEITCLVDNYTDILLPNSEVVRRPVISENWYEWPFIAEHGFCAALTIRAGGVKHRLLLDSGLDPMAASHNAGVLGFDLHDCESVISSHGHIDHAGGLLNIRRKMDRERKIPLVLHADAFRNRLARFQDGRTINLPAPDRALLAEAGYDIVEKNSSSMWADDTVLVTGEIPRSNNFEKGLPNHYAEVDGEMEADPLIKDDQAAVINVKDKGLIVITGCGHAGIVNTLNYAKELTGVDRVHAVIGGMHLSGALFEPIIPRTIEELEKIKPRSIVPCHCSGLKAVSEMARRMPEAFIQNSVGTSYSF